MKRRVTYRNNLRISQIPHTGVSVDIIFQDSAYFGFVLGDGEHHAALESGGFAFGGVGFEHCACNNEEWVSWIIVGGVVVLVFWMDCCLVDQFGRVRM